MKDEKRLTSETLVKACLCAGNSVWLGDGRWAQMCQCGRSDTVVSCC